LIGERVASASVSGDRTHGYNCLETRASRCAFPWAMGGMSMFGPRSGSRAGPLLIELRSPSENGYSHPPPTYEPHRNFGVFVADRPVAVRTSDHPNI